VIFTATAATLTILTGAAGDPQVASVGSPVLYRPAVRLTDEFGSAVPGVSVAFEVVSGGGTVDGAQATTDATGWAAVRSWRVGSSPGPNTLRATAGTFSSVIFSATAVILPTAITIEVHDSFFRSVQNGSVSDLRAYASDTVAVGGAITWV